VFKSEVNMPKPKISILPCFLAKAKKVGQFGHITYVADAAVSYALIEDDFTISGRYWRRK
jgi:hypothetical protein